MTKLTIANFRKTANYLKKNGLWDTFLTALERLLTKEAPYSYHAPSAETLDKQHERTKDCSLLFSILVPAYRTDKQYLRAMLDSVLAQSYPHFELILADATEDDSVGSVVREYQDDRIKYLHLSENKGISENTNEALKAASGSYIGLLDHDDVLTPDALFETAAAIARAGEKGIHLRLIYSDEDKCDESGTYYSEHHKKTDFNMELFLTNNYICHFMVMEAGLMKRLAFRREFDGSQDYDVALRAVGTIFAEYAGKEAEPGKKSDALLPVAAEEQICHISKVLYHWRCHENSTAANPESKDYAYEASRRAAADFLKSSGIKGQALPQGHMGYSKIRYEGSILKQRSGVGLRGGRLMGTRCQTVGGIYTEKGKCPYKGMFYKFGGYMNRALLAQDADAVDIRCMEVQPSLLPFVKESIRKSVRSLPLQESGESAEEKVLAEVDRLTLDTDGFLCGWKRLRLTDAQYRRVSIELCRAVRKAGYRVVWDSALQKKITGRR
ncbi:MAG: glycosyltransferase [Lachnospiraceae bacterium]|nr:glycosyltransferase [Lachnospiraceae bacterium]